MHALRWTSVLLFLPLAACLEMSSDQARSGVGAGEEFELELECGGGPVGPIDVEFRCTEVDVDSCKELSNVVLEFADGTHEKIDDLSGHSGTFAGSGDNEGKEIVGVWVKAGNNNSGDGPGYGERFDAPEGTCEEEEVECPGGPTGPIEVEFDCASIDVASPCRELSNVVLEFADGTHEKFDDLSGHSGTFAGTGDNEGKEIVGVWVKAGNNASGDGPGYGERFDAPGDLCEADVDGEDDGDDDGYDDEDDDDGHGDEDDDDEDDYGECS
jgi:hypothetical protein